MHSRPTADEPEGRKAGEVRIDHIVFLPAMGSNDRSRRCIGASRRSSPISKGRLLDIGCGPGQARSTARRVTSAADGRRPRRFAGDAPAGDARRGASELAVSATGRSRTAGFRDEFDSLLTVLSFHHWEEPVEGLNAVARAPESGGDSWIYEARSRGADRGDSPDDAPLWGWLRLPERTGSEDGLSGHGFTLARGRPRSRPVIARSSLSDLRRATPARRSDLSGEGSLTDGRAKGRDWRSNHESLLRTCCCCPGATQTGPADGSPIRGLDDLHSGNPAHRARRTNRRAFCLEETRRTMRRSRRAPGAPASHDRTDRIRS